jgi:hypothetical protein
MVARHSAYFQCLFRHFIYTSFQNQRVMKRRLWVYLPAAMRGEGTLQHARPVKALYAEGLMSAAALSQRVSQRLTLMPTQTVPGRNPS